MNNWLPKSILCLKSYTKRLFVADLMAGITVGLVALPLAMAFAIASGVPPQDGLYCAIVAGFAISALGVRPKIDFLRTDPTRELIYIGLSGTVGVV